MSISADVRCGVSPGSDASDGGEFSELDETIILSEYRRELRAAKRIWAIDVIGDEDVICLPTMLNWYRDGRRSADFPTAIRGRSFSERQMDAIPHLNADMVYMATIL
jgi:hypothetical protein